MTQQDWINLPQEILINIFSFLPSKDLLSLSETCRTFCNAINSCSNLMKKFKIFIFDHKKRLEWNPMRRYRKICIDSQDFGNFMEIFKGIGSDLDFLEVRYSKVDLRILREILMICENVNEIRIHVSKVTTIDDPLEQLPKLLIKKFHFLNIDPSTIQILKVFQNSSIVDLEMIGSFAQPQVLKDLLQTQNELKSFQLHNKLDEFSLFDDNSLRDANFRLQKLKLNNFDFYTQWPFFGNFIRNQTESLEVFETNQWKVFNLMGNMRKLKTVTLPTMRFTNPEPFSSVEDLTISVDYITTKEMEVCNLLENLEIQYNTVVDLNIPNVKCLKLCFFSEMNGRPFDYDNCNKLEEIRIVRCRDVEWLAEFLECENTKLKLLEIDGTSVSEKCMEVINRNSHKIEKLYIGAKESVRGI